jgi:hypothetical protein
MNPGAISPPGVLLRSTLSWQKGSGARGILFDRRQWPSKFVNTIPPDGMAPSHSIDQLRVNSRT